MTDPVAVSSALERATPDDAGQIAALRMAVALDLTTRFGTGHWSATVTENGVQRCIATSAVFVVRQRSAVIATLRLATRKPWAIDVAYFTPCGRPLYLSDMAVHPSAQHQGVGRRCLDEARRIGAEWPAESIRLDAYDAPAGAGGFYAKCGFREVGRVSYRGNPLIYFELML